MNILITGGLGYIGGRVADYIIENNPDVNIFLTTREKKQKYSPWTKRFSILEMDLLNENSIKKCLKNRKIDIILHLAALNEIESIKKPELALHINTLGTYKLLKVAQANNIERFIYFSTFHVYGKNINSIITEETPTKPFHPYAITHRAAEDFVNYFRYYYNMKTLIFRLSNGYGYPMDLKIDRWTLLFNDLCRQVATTGKIILRSSGKQHRDFISLYDIARAVEYFIFAIQDKWKDGLYNLGGNCSLPVIEVARKISDIYGIKRKKPTIERKKDLDLIKKENSNPIKYSIEKLLKTGFVLRGDMKLEIEKTIDLCEKFSI